MQTEYDCLVYRLRGLENQLVNEVDERTAIAIYEKIQKIGDRIFNLPR